MTDVKFCTHDGCYEVAIRAPRSKDHCRTHYREHVLAHVEAELVRFEVTSQWAKITDCTDQVSKGKGNIVTLDPEETTIAALVAAGLGRVIAAKPATKAGKPASTPAAGAVDG
jgi:hypothetical protein